MGYLILIIVFVVLWNLPDWIANYRYNNTNNKPDIGKMLADKYKNNLSNTQVKNNIANGKYNKK